MGRNRKTWAEKLEEARRKSDLPAVKLCDKTGKLLALPCVADVETQMLSVPQGRVRTIRQMTDDFAAKYKADMACPMLTGILVWIVAHAGDESGTPDVPWWRVVKSDGKLNPKFPGGPAKQKALLEAEGIDIEEGTGKTPPRIRNLDRVLS